MTNQPVKTLLVSIVTVSLICCGTRVAEEQGIPQAAELLEEFKTTPLFWQQAEVAERIVALGDTRVLSELERWLTVADRHLRGNVAFIFAALGDDRGWEVLGSILSDMSDRPSRLPGNLKGRQITADRYYAVHLLGKLQDERAVSILAPYLNDGTVNYKIAWALGEIGGGAAVDLLVGCLNDPRVDVRVIAIHSLEKLRARKALPYLRALLSDHERCHFDALESVSEAAAAAITALQVRD